MVQCLGIHLPMQETGAWSLVPEDSTCPGATKPLCCNYWSPQALEPVLHRRSHCTATREESPLTATGESLHTAVKTHRSQNKYINAVKSKQKFPFLLTRHFFQCLFKRKKKKQKRNVTVEQRYPRENSLTDPGSTHKRHLNMHWIIVVV